MVGVTSSLLTKTSAVNTPKTLYKFLLRRCKLLPTEDAQHYYMHMVRQGFVQHSDEVESERIQEIIQQAIKDSDWVMKKYKVTNTDIDFKTTSSSPAK